METKIESQSVGEAMLERTKIEEESEPSGSQVIAAYLSGDENAKHPYQRICRALIDFKDSDERTRINFLSQLFDTSELLNVNCKELVMHLTAIPWLEIPTQLQSNYQKLLLEIALRHIVHIETILAACVKNFRPPLGQTVPDEDLNKQFRMAHSTIAQILRCIPMAATSFVKLLLAFPHHSAPAEQCIWHLRNAIIVGEYSTELRVRIWEEIIQQLLIFDSLLTRRKNTDVAESFEEEMNIFVLDENVEKMLSSPIPDPSSRVKKLDTCMKSVFQYIAAKMGHPVEDASWLKIGAAVDIQDLLASPFDLCMLMTVDAHIVPFIWLYMCSLDTSYPHRFFDYLWRKITMPQKAASDAKKSHGAAAYLAALLARASYIGIDEALTWMEKICNWLVSYIDSQTGASSTSMTPGLLRHGTFYALCQSFFIIFCFRYKRIIANPEKWNIVRSWNLSRIINCHLQPLKYVSRPVAVCFATISRSLQLVYCFPQLAVSRWETIRLRPFEPSFPLDSYRLPDTFPYITGLMRRFSPLTEDVQVLQKEFARDKAEEEASTGNVCEDSGLAFLEEEEDEAMLIGSCSDTFAFPTAAMEDSMETFSNYYSTSPGLKAFDYGLTSLVKSRKECGDMR